MARRAAAGIAAAVVLAAALTVFVVVRDAHREGARSTTISGPTGVIRALPLPRRPVTFRIPPTRAHGRGHVYLQVGTYLQPPADTVVLTVLDARGARLARCIFPPSGYHDNSRLTCPVRDVGSVQGLRVLRRGPAKLAVSELNGNAGYLVVAEQTSLQGRISTVLDRIAVPLPKGVGGAVAVGGLFGSLLLLGLGLALVPRREDDATE